MPIFGEAASPFDEIVEKVTAETLTSENWALMMDICDDVAAKGGKASKQCLTSVKKRLNHRDPHVVLLALSLLDCLWNNCGDFFRREVSSKEFISELSYKATSSNRVIGEKTRSLIKKWSENECKKDSSLALVDSLYRDLLSDGCVFETIEPKKKIQISNDPNVVSTEEEEADIAKAIALSLNDQKDKKQTMYPTPIDNTVFMNSNSSSSTMVKRQVKALYDFEAAEDNELSFVAGDIITVLDDSDQNWWKGSSTGGVGLFPASFVTNDFKSRNGKNEMVDDTEQSQQQELPKVEIDEEILKKCFQLLQDCDPTGEIPDPPELTFYEQMSLAQATLIDQKLTQIDKQHNMLAQIDVAIRDVLAHYDSAVQQVQYQMHQNYAPQTSGQQMSNVPTVPIPTISSVGSIALQQPTPMSYPQQQHPMYNSNNQAVNSSSSISNNTVVINTVDYSVGGGGTPMQQQQPMVGGGGEYTTVSCEPGMGMPHQPSIHQQPQQPIMYNGAYVSQEQVYQQQ